jgi:serine protease AprX
MINTVTRRRTSTGTALAIAFVIAAVPATGRADNRNPREGRVGPRAREAAENARASEKIDILVRFRQSAGSSERTMAQGLGASVRRQYRAHSRWMSLRLPAHRLAALAERPSVEYVGLDEPVGTAMDFAREASNLPVLPAPETSLTGAGVGVAIVDSGVAQHPDIQTLATVVDFVAHPAPFPAPPEDSIDPNGHGTHVAGIVSGTGALSGGRHAGIAPQASLYSIRVLDGMGRGATSDVLAGLDWLLAHHAAYGIRVVNLSLGHPVFEPLADDPLVEAVEALWDAGVVVVCSAGNRGRDGFVTITSPCNSPKVITVGATNDRETGPISDDKVATYSSRGPTAFDLVAKPDLVAPGNRIASLRSPGSHFDLLLPDRRIAADPAFPEVKDYFEMSGTSMAAPIVAGAAALMLEQDPTLSPGSVKARLMMSARKSEFGDPMISGAGYLDILGALRGGWLAVAAPSPRAIVDPVTGQIAFQNTALLWGDGAYSLRYLWADSVVWTDPLAYLDPMLSTSGDRWPAGENHGNGELWPNGECWPEGELWPDSPLWSPAITEPLESGPVETEALSTGFRDE